MVYGIVSHLSSTIQLTRVLEREGIFYFYSLDVVECAKTHLDRERRLPVIPYYTNIFALLALSMKVVGEKEDGYMLFHSRQRWTKLTTPVETGQTRLTGSKRSVQS